MKVTVIGKPRVLAKGRWECFLSPQGLTLRRKMRIINIAVGSEVAYNTGTNSLTVPHSKGQLEVHITKFGSYQKRMARDLAEWLSGRRPMPLESSYILEGCFYLLCVLPFGIPVLTLGGALPVLVAFGVSVLNLQIAQAEEYPKLNRIVGCLASTAVGYLSMLVLLSLLSPFLELLRR